jgi:hypothetical protein
LLDGMLDGELKQRPAAAAWVGWSELLLERPVRALRHLDRGLALVHDNGQVLAVAPLLIGRVLALRTTGRLAEACTAAEEAVEAATLLPDGQVLVAGGSGGSSNALASAELFNPATGTWSVTGSMSQGRSGLNNVGPSATLLPDGQVLIAGGQDANFNLLASAELYNPATGKFTPTGSMATARAGQSATLLNNSQVLVAGGLVGLKSNPQTTASAMLYDPGTNTWTSTGSMTTGRESQTATLLPDGQVLMAGGTLFDHPHVLQLLASAEFYTP